MIELLAGQVVFTRVEPAYSPTRSGGYQIVYKDEKLSAADAKTIQDRIQCFRTDDHTLTRYQFFPLANDRVVVSHTSVIEAHPQIVDTQARPGVFLAHCLILERQEFEKVQNNPFAIFSSFSFLTDAETMVKRFEKPGLAPRTMIKVEQATAAEPGGWAIDEVAKLTALALNAENTLGHSSTILFYGDESGIRSALRLAFHQTPTARRPFCSFDTHVERCSVRAGTFWAVGLPEDTGGYAEKVDTAKKKVISKAGNADSRDGFYVAWLRQAAAQGNIDHLLAFSPIIQALSDMFVTHVAPQLPAELPVQDACKEFFDLNQVRVLADLTTAFTAQVGKALAAPLATFAIEAYPTHLPRFLAIAGTLQSEPTETANVAIDYLEKMYTDTKGKEPGKGIDFKLLQTLATQAKDSLLQFWAAALPERVEDKLRLQALREISDDDFMSALKLTPAHIPPERYVSGAHLAVLLDHIQKLSSTALDDEALLKLIKAVVEAGGGDELAVLEARIRAMENRKPLVQLEKLVKEKSDSLSSVLVAAVRERREALGAPPLTARF